MKLSDLRGYTSSLFTASEECTIMQLITIIASNCDVESYALHL